MDQTDAVDNFMLIEQDLLNHYDSKGDYDRQFDVIEKMKLTARKSEFYVHPRTEKFEILL